MSTQSQPRTPDGRYSFKRGGAGLGSLEEPGSVEAEVAAWRSAQLSEHGAVPAVSIARAGRAERATFWRDALRTAPLSTTDPAPKIDMRAGGVKGQRRTYAGGAGELTMPSVAAINRMADHHDGAFDIPVQAGNDHGHVAGWVRVARGSNGTWAVESMGMDEPYASYARRQVSWVLGAEHPSFAMNEFGSAAAMFAEQDRLAGVEPAAVRSSAVQEVGYDESTSTLYTTLKDGSVYGHKAPRHVYDRMLEESAGSVWAREVAHHAEPVHAEQCPACGRYYSVTGGRDHDCPSGAGDLSASGRGDDARWAGGLRDAYTSARMDALIAAHSKARKPPAGIPMTGLSTTTERFSLVSGADAAEMHRLIGYGPTADSGRLRTLLAAAATDPSVSVTGRRDSDGLAAEEVQVSGVKDATSAMERLRKAGVDLPEPDRVVVRKAGVRLAWF